MAEVVFFEKPGCINNTRQKKLLTNAGHHVIAKNLLEHDWKPDELLKYFTGLPVPLWFNQSAPSVKSGEIMPEEVTQTQAIELMINNPLLIRRPLINVNSQYKVGFDFTEIHNWIGLKDEIKDKDLELCPRSHEEESEDR